MVALFRPTPEKIIFLQSRFSSAASYIFSKKACLVVMVIHGWEEMEKAFFIPKLQAHQTVSVSIRILATGTSNFLTVSEYRNISVSLGYM